MPRSAKAASRALDAVGRGRDRHRQRHDESDLGALAEPRSREEVVHEQRGLARSRRALERRRGHGDDHPSAFESAEHVAAGERTRALCRTRGRLRRAPASRPGRRSAPSAITRMSASKAPASVSTRLAAGSIERDGRLHELHAGLDDVGVGVVHRIGSAARPNITSSFEKPKTNDVGPVDEHDVDVVAELVGQAAWSARDRRSRRPGRRSASAVVQRELGGGLAGDAGVPHPARLRSCRTASPGA